LETHAHASISEYSNLLLYLAHKCYSLFRNVTSLMTFVSRNRCRLSIYRIL